MKDRIYIQIPAYRDNQLQSTLYDLLENAACKESLRIGVAWQHAEDEQLDRDFLKRHRVEVIDIPAGKSRGCNWARSLLQERWMGEEYTLFLDSHHRFTPGWDRQLVDMYETLRSGGVAKPLITAYLPVYDPQNDPAARQNNPLQIRFFKRERGLLFRLNSREMPSWLSLQSPVPAQFISLHFLFAEGNFNEVLEFDPSIYFFADEVAISLRAYTMGYDLFHPHRILGWHLYDRTATRVTHWEDHPEWRQQNEYSYHQLTDLFRGNKKGRFGIGRERTVAGYEEYIGMKLIE
jgi:hypothetical protein